MRTFAKIVDTVGKMYVNYVDSNVNKFLFQKIEFSSELREHSLDSRIFLCS